MKITSRFLLLMFILLAGSIFAQQDIPYLTGRVTDNAQIISPQIRQSLTENLKAYETRTGNQIAVLTIPTLNGESIEDYADEVFQEWKLGQKGIDNGLLILVVPNDRRMRIEIGYGLEGVLTDGTAGQIIRTIMTPRFKDGDYGGGITAGVQAVIAVLDGSELPNIADDMDNSDDTIFDGPDLSLKERILIGAFIFGIIGLFTLIGIVTPGVGWFLYIFLIPFWAMFPIVILGTRGAFVCLVTYLIAFPLLKILFKQSKWYKKAKKNLRVKGKSAFGGFNFSSGSSSGSWSSSGSSFSGGGGSSGGGGASGSW